MCGAIHELARERNEMEQLAVVWESQVRELRESQEAQACTSKREQKRRQNEKRQLEAAKEGQSPATPHTFALLTAWCAFSLR
jgi:hypothetical protein